MSMTITSNSRFLYIFGWSGLLCAAAAVVVARIYKKSKKISDDHVCRHFTHSSLSLSKLSALCGKLNQRQDILFKICELAQICFMYTNFQKRHIPQLNYGFCKELLWYKWTFDQLNLFVLTFSRSAVRTISSSKQSVPIKKILARILSLFFLQ